MLASAIQLETEDSSVQGGGKDEGGGMGQCKENTVAFICFACPSFRNTFRD